MSKLALSSTSGPLLIICCNTRRHRFGHWSADEIPTCRSGPLPPIYSSDASGALLTRPHTPSPSASPSLALSWCVSARAPWLVGRAVAERWRAVDGLDDAGALLNRPCAPSPSLALCWCVPARAPWLAGRAVAAVSCARCESAADLRRSGRAPCWRGSPAACACSVSPGPPSSHAATGAEPAAVGRRWCWARRCRAGRGSGGAGRGVEKGPLDPGLEAWWRRRSARALSRPSPSSSVTFSSSHGRTGQRLKTRAKTTFLPHSLSLKLRYE